jgi:hypothetical protein
VLRRYLVLALSCFLSASVVLWVRQRLSATTPPVAPRVGALTRLRQPGRRREMLFVLIASSRSYGVRDPGFKQHLARARELVAHEATARGAVFGSIGISVDPVVDDGLEFLHDVGPFDEVDSGNNWESLGATVFLWRGVRVEPAVPQVLVVARDVDARNRLLVLGAERLLVQKIGSDSVIAWAAAGAPLPTDSVRFP